jgi:hypothetical protein
MNERIRQLATNSRFKSAIALQIWGTVDHLTDSEREDLIRIEKFAEALIRECAGVNYNSPFQDGEFHAREVLEHFGLGVEE